MNCLQNGCDSLLRAHSDDFSVSGLQIDFSVKQMTSTFNGFFTTMDAKEMLEEKEFVALDMVFSFISSFLDRASEYWGQPILPKIDTGHPDIVNQLLYFSLDMNVLNQKLLLVKLSLVGLMKKTNCLFESLPHVNLFKFQFHLLDHVIDDVNSFESLK